MVLDILAIILFAAAGLGAAVAVITLIELTLSWIVDWFQDRAATVRSDPDKLAVSVAEQLESGDVHYVTGIFDKSTKEFVDAQRIEAERLDPMVAQYHRKHQVAVWT